MSQFIGSGIGYRHPYRRALLDDSSEHPDLLEVMPDHFFANPTALDALAERYPIVLHDVGLSVGTESNEGAVREYQAQRLQRIKTIAARCHPSLISDHLAFTHSPSGIDLGHLAPLRFTHCLLDHVSARVSALQDALSLPIALENITTPFVIDGDLSEAEFFSQLVARTGCGVLLDLTNLLINGRNLGFSPAARLSDYPLSAVTQVHLAGPRHDGGWIDGHDAPVDDESFALLALFRDRAPLVAIIVERDDRLPPLAELVGEAKRAAIAYRGR